MRKFYAVAILAVSSAFAVFSTSAIAANPQVTFETNRGNFVVEHQRSDSGTVSHSRSANIDTPLCPHEVGVTRGKRRLECDNTSSHRWVSRVHHVELPVAGARCRTEIGISHQRCGR